jgi:hypothetical protein
MADALDAIYDPVREVFAIYGKMWIDGPDGGMHWKHAMGRIESKDFIHWSRPQLLLAPDDQDPAWVEFHTSSMAAFTSRPFKSSTGRLTEGWWTSNWPLAVTASTDSARSAGPSGWRAARAASLTAAQSFFAPNPSCWRMKYAFTTGLTRKAQPGRTT